MVYRPHPLHVCCYTVSYKFLSLSPAAKRGKLASSLTITTRFSQIVWSVSDTRHQILFRMTNAKRSRKEHFFLSALKPFQFFCKWDWRWHVQQCKMGRMVREWDIWDVEIVGCIKHIFITPAYRRYSLSRAVLFVSFRHSPRERECKTIYKWSRAGE